MKTKSIEPTKKKSKVKKVLAQLACVVFLLICGLLIFFNLSHEYHIVSGTSMVPTLNVDGTTDGVFVSKIKHYNRGDIIVAKSGEIDEATNEEKIVIKRLIAIGGDKITVREVDGVNRVFIIYKDSEEETMLDEPYLQDYSVNSDLKKRFTDMVKNCDLSQDSQGYITIAGDDIFYLGDNRRVSKDCATYGPRNKSNVVGLVDYIAYGNKYIYWQVIKQFFGGK